MAHSTSETAFVTVEKSFTYRGQREHWQNAYHFDQVPGSTADWAALAHHCMDVEATFLPSDVHFEFLYGHSPGTPPLLMYEEDVPPSGEGGPTGGFNPQTASQRAAGDAAIWQRFGTTQKNSLGKPIWLRNYYHAVYAPEALGDNFLPEQKTLLDAWGAQLVAGINVNGVTYRRAGPRGAIAQNHSSSIYITTRTLKHRGKHRGFKVPAGSTLQLPAIPFPGPVTIN